MKGSDYEKECLDSLINANENEIEICRKLNNGNQRTSVKFKFTGQNGRKHSEPINQVLTFAKPLFGRKWMKVSKSKLHKVCLNYFAPKHREKKV